MNTLMAITLVPHNGDGNNKETIYIPSQLAKRWRMETSGEIKLCVGRKSISVQSVVVNEGTNEIRIHEQLLRQFSLPPHSFNFNAKFDQSKKSLKVGPVIGLITDFSLEENQEPNLRSVRSFCEELEKGVRLFGGFFYVFSHLHFTKEGVRGFYYKEERWLEGDLPFPDVIYNRIHSRKLDIGYDIQPFRKLIEEIKIPFFNDRFLSKWEVYNFLSKEAHMAPFLPDTRIFSKENLKEMTDLYDTVFIKPVHGSQGRNIIKIIKSDQFFLAHTSNNPLTDNEIEQTLSLDHIPKAFNYLLKKRIFIIQQGIDLISYHSRQLDFRILCHKNQQNIWESTSTIARVCAPLQFVSNVARGGEILKPADALIPTFNRKDVRQQIALMKELALEAASIISQNTQGLIGELGADIGIDHNGKLWIIEMNSKPSKNFEDSTLKIRPSAKAIIRYCTSLCFNPEAEKDER